MAQTNYTPISLYYSTTASAVPTAANLVPGELAINTNDGKLYYEDSSGVVQVLASKATSSGTFTTISVSGVATFSAGTVSLPAITTTGDTNTGIFFPAADTIAFTEGGAEAMRIDSSGNVGIGTTTSALVTRLTLANPDNTTNGQIRCAWSGDIPNYYWEIGRDNQTTGDFIFSNASGGAKTERMRINSSGNLLVGTTSAYASGATPHLFVSANTSGAYVAVFKNANATPGCLILDLSADPNNSSDTYIATGQNRFKVLSNGNVQNTNNSYGAISDVKLKENIVDASPKLTDLMQVKVRNYNLIGETTKQIGVVAQELETVFPSMVDESFDRDAEGNDLGTTTKSVKYSVFVPMLIKAIQELKAEFDAYKATHP
jgi:hypothetical protein